MPNQRAKKKGGLDRETHRQVVAMVKRKARRTTPQKGSLPRILDTDLAIIYDVRTKWLNEQCRCNSDRFAEDFLFELTRIE